MNVAIERPPKADKPVVTIVHALPGRLRARFSHAPRDMHRLRAAILEHEGLDALEFTRRTGSVLVHFDPRVVTQQEIALRLAVQLSLDYGARPVRLLARADNLVLENTAVLAAGVIGSAHLLRWLGAVSGRSTSLDWAAGITTALAVADHAWKETRQRGYFDPEVLSLGYLATAVARRNVLNASTVTWLAAFGRHLVSPAPNGVEVRPVRVGDHDDGRPSYQITIGPDTDAPERVQLLGAMQGLLKYALTGGSPETRQMWDELRDVSRVHGEVLEGLGQFHGGIPVRFTDGNGGKQSWR